ncbi:MAG: type II toxin-antitoxin system VapB family antitoxin [Clostridiales bacterium]|nr:type II toxin-antitoxin system VapB family antitoxin [Clostridiales bacterium]
MATNLSIDTRLLDEALAAGGLKTKKDTVNMALDEFIKRRKAAEILSMFGKVEYDAGYDYKEARQRSR